MAGEFQAITMTKAAIVLTGTLFSAGAGRTAASSALYCSASLHCAASRRRSASSVANVRASPACSCGGLDTRAATHGAGSARNTPPIAGCHVQSETAGGCGRGPSAVAYAARLPQPPHRAGGCASSSVLTRSDRTWISAASSSCATVHAVLAQPGCAVPQPWVGATRCTALLFALASRSAMACSARLFQTSASSRAICHGQLDQIQSTAHTRRRHRFLTGMGWAVVDGDPRLQVVLRLGERAGSMCEQARLCLELAVQNSVFCFSLVLPVRESLHSLAHALQLCPQLPILLLHGMRLVRCHQTVVAGPGIHAVVAVHSLLYVVVFVCAARPSRRLGSGSRG
jgi:hypothetical protein